MDPRLRPLASAWELNTRLHLNCLHGMDQRTAERRASAETNSPLFLALHLLDSRHLLARLVGLSIEHPYAAMLEEVRRIEDLQSHPPVEEVRSAWLAVSAAIQERLAGLRAGDLDEASPVRFPVSDTSMLGAVAFLLQHDSYHIGQLALLRKLFGLGAMSYAELSRPNAPR